MSNADLIKRLRDGITLGLFHPILNEAADALEQCERAKVELALENGKLRARLNRWELKK